MEKLRFENIKKSFKELKWYEYLMGIVMIVIAARAMVLGFTFLFATVNSPRLVTMVAGGRPQPLFYDFFMQQISC